MTRTSIGGEIVYVEESRDDAPVRIANVSQKAMVETTVRWTPKTALACKLYAIRQREIAAGRLVLRDSQEILDEIEASRA